MDTRLAADPTRAISRFLLLFILTTAPLYASDPGTFSFLRNDVSPRSAALGGGFVTMTNDPAAIFYNPAALGTLGSERLGVGFYKHLLDINSGYACYGREIPDFGFVGGGVEYINYGKFDAKGPEGQDLGTFGAGEIAITAGYAGELPGGMHYGANVKYIYSSIAEYFSSAVALDAGIQYILVRDRILFGASLTNFGTQFSPYMNTRETLPLDLTMGFSVYPEHLPAVVTLNFQKLNEAVDGFAEHFKMFSVGAELSPASNIQVRVGYNNESRQELKLGSSAGFAGFSAGLGISSGEYTIDYAFSSFGGVGSVHRVSVSFDLSPQPAP